MCKKCSPFSSFERTVNETLNTAFATGKAKKQKLSQKDELLAAMRRF